MKKLTKTLSLVLVVAMVLSLCVIGAGATFTDNDKITKDYSEAVTIATDLGIVKGMGNNTFAPTGTFTRAQAAVILTNITLGANASAVAPTTQTFKDVPTSFWGYKYIEYAAQAGLVAGTGNGNFSPNATLNGYQWALMLLKVRGLDTTNMTAGNWQISTAKAYYADGTKFSSVAISTAAVTREAATQMTYDAIFTSLSGKTGYPVIKVVDSSVVGVYDTVAEATMMANVLNAQSSDYTVGATKVNMGTDYMAKTVFGVTKNDTKTDAFARPATVYTADTAARGTLYGWTNADHNKTIAAVPTLTYTTAVTEAKVYADLGLSANIVAPATNNMFTDNVGSKQAISYNGGAITGTGNGVLTEVYYTASSKSVKLVLVNTYLGTVSDVVAATGAQAASAKITAVNTTVLGNNFSATYKTAELKNKDVVLFTAARNAGDTAFVVQSAKVVTPTTLTATSYTDSSFVAGGKTYQYSATASGKLSGASAFAPLNAYTDSYGYVIFTTAPEGSANYAVVLDLGVTPGIYTNNDTYYAKLLYADGTTKDVVVDKDYRTGMGTYGAAGAGTLVGEVVTYADGTGAATGKVVLTKADSTTYVAETALKFVKGNATFTWNSTSYVANANTVFLVKTVNKTTSAATYTAYKGIANAPTMSGSVAGAVATKSGVATVVYVVSPAFENAASTTAVFYSDVTSVVHVSASTSYYATKALVNGVETDLKLTADPGTVGVYTVLTTDAATGYSTLTELLPTNTGTSAVGNAFTSVAFVAASNGVVQINGASFGYTADCVVYYYDTTTGALTKTSMDAVSSAASMTGYYVQTVVGGPISALYIAK